MEHTEVELSAKYGGIEDKIPGTWPTYDEAGGELARDIAFLWDIRDNELIRVIALVSIRCPGLRISNHIDRRFSFAGLYPERMRDLSHIKPDDGQA